MVDMVRHVRESRTDRHRPSLRAAIMIARVVVRARCDVRPKRPPFSRAPTATLLGPDRNAAHGKSRIRSHDVMNEELADVCKHVETAIQESS